MATASPLSQIDEKFLQCSICLEQLKQPKLLPCGHHFCRDCLAETVPDRDTDIHCPTCREIHVLPLDGVDGYTDDFNTSNIIEYVQSQGSDHVGEGKSSNQCPNHPDKEFELFCATCDNKPICVSCNFRTHKGHDLQDMTLLAEAETKKLKKRTASLKQYEQWLLRQREGMGNKMGDLRNKIEDMRNKMEDMRDKMEKADEKFKQYDKLVKRFEDVSIRAPCVLGADHHEMDVQKLKDLSAYIEDLLGELKRENPGITQTLLYYIWWSIGR